MTIEIVEGRYYAVAWFAEGRMDGRKADFMGCAWRESPGSRWILQYRYRYHEDNRAHDSADRKSWWRAELDGAAPEERACAGLRLVAETWAEAAGGSAREVVLRTTSAERVMEVLAADPWTTVRSESDSRHERADRRPS